MEDWKDGFRVFSSESRIIADLSDYADFKRCVPQGFVIK